MGRAEWHPLERARDVIPEPRAVEDVVVVGQEVTQRFEPPPLGNAIIEFVDLVGGNVSPRDGARPRRTGMHGLANLAERESHVSEFGKPLAWIQAKKVGEGISAAHGSPGLDIA